MSKRKGAPSFNGDEAGGGEGEEGARQGKDKVSRTGEKDENEGGVGEGKRIADVKGKFLTLFRKEEDIGGMEGLDDGDNKEGEGSKAGEGGWNGEEDQAIITVEGGGGAPSLSDDTILAMVEGMLYIRDIYICATIYKYSIFTDINIYLYPSLFSLFLFFFSSPQVGM